MTLPSDSHLSATVVSACRPLAWGAVQTHVEAYFTTCDRMALVTSPSTINTLQNDESPVGDEPPPGFSRNNQRLEPRISVAWRRGDDGNQTLLRGSMAMQTASVNYNDRNLAASPEEDDGMRS